MANQYDQNNMRLNGAPMMGTLNCPGGYCNMPVPLGMTQIEVKSELDPPMQGDPSEFIRPRPAFPDSSGMKSDTVIVNPNAMPPIDNINPEMPINAAPGQAMDTARYMNDFLRTQIGRRVSVDFLVGMGTVVTKTGLLLAVGYNYILLNESNESYYVACDFYNIKFVRVYY